MGSDFFSKKKKAELKFPIDIKKYQKDIRALHLDTGVRILPYGEEGTGKTYLAITFPANIALIEFEPSLHRVMQKVKEFDREDDILYFDAYEISEDGKDSVASIEKFEAIVLSILQKREELNINTVVVDSYSYYWTGVGDWNYYENERKGALTAKGTVSQFNWGPANVRIKRLTMRLMTHIPNVVLICHEKAYEGFSKPAAAPRAKNWIDFIVRMEKRTIGNSVKFIATIEKAGMSKLSKRVEIEDLTFNKLVKAVKEEFGVEIPVIGDCERCK